MMNKRTRQIQPQGNSISRTAATAIGRKRGNGNGSKLKQGGKTETALRESEEKYRNLFEYAKDAIILADTQTGTILDVNTAGCNLLGLPKEKIIGKHQSELHPPELAERYKQLFQDHIQKGVVIDEDIIVQRADGTQVPIDISASVVKLGDKTIIQGIFRDVSERLRMAKALKESEEKFSKAFRAIPEAISISRFKDGVFIEVNDNYCLHNGLNRDEVIGRTAVELGLWDQFGKHDLILEGLQKKNRIENMEVAIKINTGEIHYVLLSAEKFNIGDELYVLALGNDITERKRMEEALRQSESKYSSLVERSNDGIIIIENGILKFINTKMAEMTGFTREEALGRKFIDFSPPVEKQKLIEIHKKRMAGEDVPTNYEATIIARDGHRILAEVNACLITYEGRPAVMAIIRNITERKQAEQALNDEATRHRILIEQSHDGIVILDQDGRVYEANQKFADMLGYTPEEVRQLSVFDWDSQTPREEVIEKIRTADEKGDHFEAKQHRKDGTIFDAEISTNGAIFGGQRLLFCVVRDITKRKRAEQALNDEATRRRILIEQSRDGIVILDQDGSVYEANQKFADMLGYALEEVRQLHVFDWEFSYPREQVVQMIRTVDEKGDHFETQHRRKDGTTFDVEISTNGAMFAGRKLIFCVCRDITERKKMEQAVRESEEKFSKAFHASPQQIIITRDKDDVTVDVNDSFTQVTGFTHEETIGKTSKELGVWQKPEDNFKLQQLLKDNGRIVNEEFEFINKAGEKHTQLVSIEPITIGGEKCWISIATDITKMKQTENALRESEEKISKAFQAIPEAISIVSREDDVFLEVNDSFISFSGYSREEIIGHTTKEIVHWVNPDDNHRMTQLKDKHTHFKNEEFLLCNKSGETITILMSGDVINFGGKSCTLMIGADITERKRMDQALAESEEKFSKAFLNSPEAIVISNIDDGEILEVNDTFLNLFGYTREDVIGKKANEINTWIRPEERAETIKILKEKGIVSNRECLFRIKSGEIRTLLFSAEIINIGDKPCMLSVNADITERKKIEQALRESEEKFSKAFRAMPESVSISRLDDGTFIDVNASFCRDTGKTREEVIGQSGDWVEPGQRAQIVKMIKEQGRAENIECEFIKKSGELHTLLISADIINIGGEPCMLSIGSDITERKKMEKALKESEEKFYKAFHAMPEAVCISRMRDSVFIDVNDSFCRNNEYTREEVIGHSGKELITWVDPGQRDEVFNLIYKQGHAENIECEFRKKSGKIHIALFSADTINIGGEPCMLSITSDITERKMMEIAIRESEEKFSKAFHAIPETLSISTVKEGRFIDVNEKFLKLNRLTREEVIGHTGTEIDLLKPGDKRNKIRDLLKKQNQFTNLEIEFKAKSGKMLTFLFSANTINIGGEPCLLIIGNDITERKLAEKKLQKALVDLEQSSALLKSTNQELESFSYSVSHDLRSPLRSIDGFSQALLEDYTARLDEKGQDYLNRLRNASQKMGELIDGLLKLSRLTRSEMHHEKVDLTSLAAEIATRLQETHDKRDVKFIIGNDLTATGDPQMLRVLLENLLGNAFKFTKNIPQARIEFGSTTDGERKTYFIKDNGAGFDMAFKDKLFGAFQRLHDPAEFPGTGIGLATVQRIINRHGGNIRAEGAVGEGAAFYFTLN